MVRGGRSSTAVGHRALIWPGRSSASACLAPSARRAPSAPSTASPRLAASPRLTSVSPSAPRSTLVDQGHSPSIRSWRRHREPLRLNAALQLEITALVKGETRLVALAGAGGRETDRFNAALCCLAVAAHATFKAARALDTPSGELTVTVHHAALCGRLRVLSTCGEKQQQRSGVCEQQQEPSPVWEEPAHPPGDTLIASAWTSLRALI